jgi:hypothetical protein
MTAFIAMMSFSIGWASGGGMLWFYFSKQKLIRSKQEWERAIKYD